MSKLRENWPAGPWDNEPDSESFEHAGLPCRIVRHSTLGHLCGYVGVPEGHPAYGMSYDDVEVSVHGGFTYGSYHAPGTTPNDGRYWFGFDCAHTGDLVPYMAADHIAHDTYKTVDYVRSETKELAEHLANYTGLVNCPHYNGTGLLKTLVN